MPDDRKNANVAFSHYSARNPQANFSRALLAYCSRKIFRKNVEIVRSEFRSKHP
ncbi:Protein CBG25855 [Caenorhabditis briggsae]|uniref:Protein CBG25855 n=1 Tax=Caenorhabditis briggsae TaxID=6238 RepID=B6IIT2_CAEBR|nr:Protein CBG25855 [Caenorhabditis briggsae]CAR99812.1 Protein CBG25855 [Caenorhabditis briggsae]